MKCGLLGKTLSHSYSPYIHSFLGEYSYELFEKQPEELERFLKSGDFVGLNVTMPYKKDVIPYCDELTACAKKLLENVHGFFLSKWICHLWQFILYTISKAFAIVKFHNFFCRVVCKSNNKSPARSVQGLNM